MKSPARIIDEIKQPLPPFALPVHARLAAAEALRPPEMVTVAEAAEKYRFLNNLGGGYVGPWRNATVPQLVEPMEALTSRLYRTTCFVGPAQSGKTDALFLNWLLYSAICDPADMLLVQTTKGIAEDFSERRLRPMVDNCPELAELLDRSRSSMLRWAFKTGMLFSLAWPSQNELRGRPVPRVGATDYDATPENVGGEGALYDLLKPRTRTFGSSAMVCIESSPGRPILKPDWKPGAGHEAPPTTGILSVYNMGTRGRLHWPCPHCEEYFEGDFDKLKYPASADPREAGEAAEMACPHCGALAGFALRREMLAAGLWVHEGQRVEGREVVGERRNTDVASYWLKGVAATFATWADLVAAEVNATRHLEATGDEEPLKATRTADQGLPYLYRAQKGARLDADKLRQSADAFPLRVVPAAARVLVAAVDVQGNRFVVQVEAWGERRERWLIDRFELFTPPAGAPGRGEGEEAGRMLDPGAYLEDWRVIEESVLDRTYPTEADPELELRIKLVLVDSGGSEGVTANAYDWWRGLRRRRLHGRVSLVKGGTPDGAPRVAETFPDSKRKDRNAGARGEVPVLALNTNRLKDEVWNAASRAEPGPGKLHLSRDLPDQVFAELCAEERGPNGWRMVSTGARNEALDLCAYASAGAVRLGLDKMNWTRAPAWARPAPDNSLAVRAEDLAQAKEAPVETRAERLARIAKGLA